MSSMHLRPIPQGAAGTGAALETPGIWRSDPMTEPTECSFASLVDLARMRLGSSPIEISEVCNTVNLGSPHQCKGCAHKLSAHYSDSQDEAKLPRLEVSGLPLLRAWTLASRSSFNDFAAFALVINLVVAMVAQVMPM